MNDAEDEFEEMLGETDFGFIVDSDGNLKALWVPEGQEDEDVPDSIVRLIKYCFGIDPSDEDNYGTIH